MKIRSLIVPASLAVVCLLAACSKDKNGTTNLRIHLTDNPYDATEVNVDIKEVNVKFKDTSWINLETKQGVYNLLDFQNGIDTVLAEQVVPTGALQEVRFVLGDDNSITIDNVNYPLTIPGGSESGLKIKLNKQLQPDLDSLVIDFDVALSILQTGTGDYKLKPVLKIK